jgi:hypothetical protein
VQDQILTELARIADLKVISRTSVLQYKSGAARNLREIGQQLGVAHLLEGSVQRAGNKVRVNAQLIDTRTDAHLWAENYDRPLDDVFAIQSEIAKAIANQLQAKIAPNEKAAIEKPPTTDLAAYDLYLRAQALFADTSDLIHAREKLPQAERVLNEAVARDPHFLLAWCLLARVRGQIYFIGFDHTGARLESANVAAQTAIQANLTLPWPITTIMASVITSAPAASWLSPGAPCPTMPKCSNTPDTLIAAKVIGKKPRAISSALLTSIRVTTSPSSNWH